MNGEVNFFNGKHNALTIFHLVQERLTIIAENRRGCPLGCIQNILCIQYIGKIAKID